MSAVWAVSSSRVLLRRPMICSSSFPERRSGSTHTLLPTRLPRRARGPGSGALAAGGLSDNESQRGAHGHRPDDCKRLSATREAALKELVGTNRWFFAAALTASKAPIRCPITGYPCEGDISHLCEDYGCARKGGLSPCSDENL